LGQTYSSIKPKPEYRKKAELIQRDAIAQAIPSDLIAKTNK